MAKNITRTIQLYTYYFGNFNPQTMTMENMTQIPRPYKLGSRQRKELEKELGKTFVSETSTEVLYEMSIEDFVRYGHPAEE